MPLLSSNRVYFSRQVFTGQVTAGRIVYRRIHVQHSPDMPDDTPVFYVDPNTVVDGSLVEDLTSESVRSRTMLAPCVVEWEGE